MTLPRLTGTHHHMFNNLPDVQPDEDANPGDVFTLDDDLHPIWTPPTGGGGAMALRLYVPFGSGTETFTP